MTKIKTLKNFETGEQYAPRTHVKAVFDDQGNTLDSLLGVQDEKLSELGSELGGTITNSFLASRAEHSSEKDGIKIKISEGSEFSISVFTDDAVIGGISVYAVDSSTGERKSIGQGGMTIGTQKSFIAPYNISEISLYFTVTTAGTIRFSVTGGFKEETKKMIDDVGMQSSMINDKCQTSERLMDVLYNGILSPLKNNGITLVSLKAGNYRMLVSSSTGITQFTGTDDQSLWIEIYARTSSNSIKLYSLYKTDTFADKEVIFSLSEEAEIIMNPSRYGSEERLKVALCKDVFLRTTAQNLDNEQKEIARNNIGSFGVEEFKAESESIYASLGGTISKIFLAKIGEHSSKNDRVNVNVSSGSKFSVLCTSEDASIGTISVYAVDAGGTYKSVGSTTLGKKQEFVAPFDVKNIGVYFTVSTGGTINFSVIGGFKEDITKRMASIENSYGNIVSESYVPKKDTTINICTLKPNISYVLAISSSTGITQFTGTDGQSLWIEIRAKTSAGYKKIYTLNKTDVFSPKIIYYTPTEEAELSINPSRYGVDELLDVVVYTKQQYDVFLRPQEQILDEETKSIIRKNIGALSEEMTVPELNKEGVNMVLTAKTKLDSYGVTGYMKYLSLLVMTDSHADWTRVNRVFDFSKEEIVDMVIHCGDIVEGSGQFSGYNWAQKVLSSAKPVIAIPGNHEFQYVPNSTTYIGLKDEDVAALLYTSDIVSHNEEHHPTIGGVFKNYYYKDITKNGYTIRIIALYQYEWNSPVDENGNPIYGDGNGKDVVLYSQEQVDWFVATLKNTPSEYGVVILTHSMLTMCKYEECEFVLPEERGEISRESTLVSRLSNPYFFAEIIKAYISGSECNVESDQYTPDGVNYPISVSTTFSESGKVIANICGHKHNGGLMRMVDSNNEVFDCRVVMSPCTSASDAQNYGWWGRKTDGRLQDNLNVITYDNDRDLIKVVRFGSIYNNDMKEAKSYSF